MSWDTVRKVYQSELQKGDNVVVVAGRKVPIGTKGKIFWIGQPQVYGKSNFPIVRFRIGLRDSKGQAYFTDAGNVRTVKVPNAMQNLIDAENYANDIDPEVENNLDGTVEW